MDLLDSTSLSSRASLFEEAKATPKSKPRHKTSANSTAHKKDPSEAKSGDAAWSEIRMRVKLTLQDIDVVPAKSRHLTDRAIKRAEAC